MLFRVLYRCIRKRQRESFVVIPGVPVVHVMRAEGLSGFAQHQVEGGGVEVGEVDGHSFTRAKAASDLLDGVAAARLRLPAWSDDAGMAVQDGKPAEYRMDDLHRILFAILP